jgi:hypothetical protein
MTARQLATVVPARIALAAAVLLVAAPGCSTKPTSRGPQVESIEGRFPHASHGRIACTDCHAAAAVAEGRPAVPGARDHAPCDQSGCHREQFLAPPGPFCTTCHTAVDPTGAEPSPIAYPPSRGPRALASRFSHRVHLDYGAMERQVGFHVSCTDCHTARADGELARPDHAVCSRCHAPEAALDGAPRMDSCDGCHRARSVPPRRTRRVIVGDLHFRHVNHRRDRTGKLIICSDCHADAATVDQAGRHRPPATRSCVTCHDDVARVPSAMRMRVCETCHATLSKTLAQLPPRSHLPEPARPTSHTLAFRRDHGVEARTNPRNCARCHTFMSGAPRDSCDECHKQMRPTDHVVTFREFEHGAAARARSERCATCHQADFCIACHQRPPRSHFPLMEFARSGHGTVARFDYRACVTCHQPDRDCTGSGCHTVRPRP